MAVCSSLLLETAELEMADGTEQHSQDHAPASMLFQCGFTRGLDSAFAYSTQSNHCRKFNIQGKDIFSISLRTNLLYTTIPAPPPSPPCNDTCISEPFKQGRYQNN